MNPVFGIHVGNSTACLAIYKPDDSKFCVEVIANNAGDRVMPAIVTVTDTENVRSTIDGCVHAGGVDSVFNACQNSHTQSNEVVGAACKSLLISRWNTTITCNKRMLNRDSPDGPSNGEKKVQTILRDDGELCYNLPMENGEEQRTPTEIATCIYHSLYEIARSAVPGEEGDISCVLMVPKHFTDEARFKVRTAAEAVGWDVLHIINEPAAAVLGYNLLSEKTPPPTQTVLVYRVGGRSCDATIVELKYGIISILDTEHSDELGGKLILSALTKYLADEFYRRNKLDPKDSHRALTKLILAAENCIHVLSTIKSANCFVESLCEGVDFSHTMSRARFESLLFPFLTLFTRPIRAVLTRLNMTPDDVDTVLLCGGLLKIPRLKEHISDLFQDSCAKVMDLPNGINYDEVLACGAAQQAGYIALDQMGDNFLPNDLEISVLEYPVTVEVEGADFDSVEFQPGQPLPIHENITLRPFGNQVTITFTQVESEEIIMRGQIQLEDLENPTDISLDVESDSTIKVGIPEEPDVFTYHTVRMYAYPNLL